MKITVKFNGETRRAAGRQNMQVFLNNGQTLKDLILTLGNLFSSHFERTIVSPLLDGTTPLTMITINSIGIRDFGELERPLQNGDVVSFETPATGE